MDKKVVPPQQGGDEGAEKGAAGNVDQAETGGAPEDPENKSPTNKKNSVGFRKFRNSGRQQTGDQGEEGGGKPGSPKPRSPRRLKLKRPGRPGLPGKLGKKSEKWDGKIKTGDFMSGGANDPILLHAGQIMKQMVFNHNLYKTSAEFAGFKDRTVYVLPIRLTSQLGALLSFVCILVSNDYYRVVMSCTAGGLALFSTTWQAMRDSERFDLKAASFKASAALYLDFIKDLKRVELRRRASYVDGNPPTYDDSEKGHKKRELEEKVYSNFFDLKYNQIRENQSKMKYFPPSGMVRYWLETGKLTGEKQRRIRRAIIDREFEEFGEWEDVADDDWSEDLEKYEYLDVPKGKGSGWRPPPPRSLFSPTGSTEGEGKGEGKEGEGGKDAEGKEGGERGEGGAADEEAPLVPKRKAKEEGREPRRVRDKRKREERERRRKAKQGYSGRSQSFLSFLNPCRLFLKITECIDKTQQRLADPQKAKREAEKAHHQAQVHKKRAEMEKQYQIALKELEDRMEEDFEKKSKIAEEKGKELNVDAFEAHYEPLFGMLEVERAKKTKALDEIEDEIEFADLAVDPMDDPLLIHAEELDGDSDDETTTMNLLSEEEFLVNARLLLRKTYYRQNAYLYSAQNLDLQDKHQYIPIVIIYGTATMIGFSAGTPLFVKFGQAVMLVAFLLNFTGSIMSLRRSAKALNTKAEAFRTAARQYQQIATILEEKVRAYASMEPGSKERRDAPTEWQLVLQELADKIKKTQIGLNCEPLKKTEKWLLTHQIDPSGFDQPERGPGGMPLTHEERCGAIGLKPLNRAEGLKAKHALALERLDFSHVLGRHSSHPATRAQTRVGSTAGTPKAGAQQPEITEEALEEGLGAKKDE